MVICVRLDGVDHSGDFMVTCERLDSADLTAWMILVMPLMLQSVTCKYRCDFMVMRVLLEGGG